MNLERNYHENKCKKNSGKKGFLNVIFCDFFLGKNNFGENYVGGRSINKNKQNILLYLYIFCMKTFTF